MKPGTLLKVCLAAEPDLLEVVLRPFLHFEPVHGNEHDALLARRG